MTDSLHARVDEALKASRARFAVPWLVRTLEKQGFETWAVGGSVRDAIRGQSDPAADWDFATAARPEQIQEVFRRTVPIGIDHGTVGVLRSRRMYEVTTFRRDVETLGRRAVVQFASTLEEDLARRDFTINAIAWHPIRGELKDPFNGIEDLEAKLLRAVGVATDRFEEDYLRILRGLRFAGRMSLSVDEATWEAMVAAVEGLATLSWERVREELVKVMTSTQLASRTLQLYADSGALQAILVELEPTLSRPEEWSRALAMVDGIGVHDPILRVAALLSPVARMYGVGTVVTTLKRLRFSNAECDRIAACVAPPFELPPVSAGPEAARRWAAAAKPSFRSSRLRLAAVEARVRSATGSGDTSDVVCAMRAIRKAIHAGSPLSIQDLAIDGRDLIRAGMKPGPAIGNVLTALLEVVLARPELNEADVLLERAKVMMEDDG